MRKLQERPEEKGELVTREDGSVAYKIRKRKRRSEQPKKEEAKKRKKIRLIQLGVVFVAIVAVVLIGVGMLLHVNSSGFREEVQSNIENTTGATMEMVQFSVQPHVARVRSMNFDWPKGNHLRSLELNSIEASLDIASFFQKRWGGQAAVAKTGTLRMQVGERDQPRVNGQEMEDFPFNFKNYRCQSLRLELLSRDRSLWSVIDNMEVSLAKTTNGSLLRTFGGNIDLKGFGQFSIDRGAITFEQGLAKFARLGLRSLENESGLLILSGNVDLYSPEPISFEIALEEFPIAKMMSHGLSQYCAGHVDTSRDSLSRYVRFKVGEPSSLELKTSFTSSANFPFTLKQLPFLKVLSQEIANQDILDGYLFDDRCQGELLRKEDQTILKNIDLADDGKFAIRGTMSSDGKELQGELFVGIGVDFLNQPSVNPELRTIFQTEDQGFFWTPVKISGSPNAPADDLEARVNQINLDKSPSTPNKTIPQAPTIEGELE